VIFSFLLLGIPSTLGAKSGYPLASTPEQSKHPLRRNFSHAWQEFLNGLKAVFIVVLARGGTETSGR
jgi:hypothetical protein